MAEAVAFEHPVSTSGELSECKHALQLDPQDDRQVELDPRIETAALAQPVSEALDSGEEAFAKLETTAAAAAGVRPTVFTSA